MYYDDTADAPWNEERNPEIEVEVGVEIVITLTKTIKVNVDDYTIKDKGIDEDGFPYTDIDVSTCDISDKVNINTIKEDLKDIDSWDIEYFSAAILN